MPSVAMSEGMDWAGRGPGGVGWRGQDRDERFHISEVSGKCFTFFQPDLDF